MSSQYNSLYKMIVLYMLDRSDSSLSKSQIYDFILEKEYTTFLTLQEILAELVATELIVEKKESNRTYLVITEAGKETLGFFSNRINPVIIDEIEAYFKANKLKIHNDNAVRADYYKTGESEYTVRLEVVENETKLLDIRMAFPTEEIAQMVCANWRAKNQSIYGYMVQELMNDTEQ